MHTVGHGIHVPYFPVPDIHVSGVAVPGIHVPGVPVPGVPALPSQSTVAAVSLPTPVQCLHPAVTHSSLDHSTSTSSPPLPLVLGAWCHLYLC